MSFGVPCIDPIGDPVTVEELDDYAREQWESILGYMVGNPGKHSGSNGVGVSQAVFEVLHFGMLVGGNAKKAQITQQGFAFLLQDVNAQIWEILMLYIEGVGDEKGKASQSTHIYQAY